MYFIRQTAVHWNNHTIFLSGLFLLQKILLMIILQSKESGEEKFIIQYLQKVSFLFGFALLSSRWGEWSTRV